MSSRRPEVGRGSQPAGIAMAALAAVAFGTVAIFVKLAYREGASALSLLGARFAITSVLLFAFHVVRGTSLRLPGRKATALVGLLGAGYAVESLLFFLALEHASAAVVSLVFYSFPLWTTLLAFVFRMEPLRGATMIALGLGTAGVIMIFSIPRSSAAGPLIALAAAVAVALYLIVAQISLRTVDPSIAAAWTAAGAAVVLTSAGLLAGPQLPAGALGPALGLGVATAIAFLAFYGSIARIGSARTAVATMLEPVATVVLAAIVLNENLTLRIVAGAALIVAAIPVLAAARPSEPTPASEAAMP